MTDFKDQQEKKRQKTILANALWVVALLCMLAGAVMFIVGMRPVLSILITLGEGGDAGNASSGQVGIVIGGVVLMLVGIVLIYVASAIKRGAIRAEQEEVNSARMLMQLNKEYAEQPKPQPKPVPAEAPKGNHFCVHCGKPIDKDDYCYCPYCGQAVSNLDKELQALAVPIDTDGIEVSDEPMWGRNPVESTARAARRCLYCGTELKENEEVCPICGHKVKYD